ncbi:MAG: hypothetical protein ACRYG4_07775 [Janthinobacterium lividum]
MTLAAAAAALGRHVTMLFDGASVAALAYHATDEGTATLLASAQELGVVITACQTGLALSDMNVGDLRAGVNAGGMVGFLASAGGAQLLLG